MKATQRTGRLDTDVDEIEARVGAHLDQFEKRMARLYAMFWLATVATVLLLKL